MAVRFMLCMFSACLIAGCGGGTSSDNGIASASSSSSSISSVSSSSQMGSSSSNAIATRQKINPSEANFFQGPGLWVGFTNIDARNRTPQNDIQKPFLEERSLETSVNTYVFASESNGLVEGVCIRTLEPEQVKGGFRSMLFNGSIGSELYCATEDELFQEIDGSYTVEYRCNEKLIGTTRLVKVMSRPEFHFSGLTLSSAQTQQPACINWNISKFEIWSLDANGNDIEIEKNAAVFNSIQLRVGTDAESVVLRFENPHGTWRVGVYDLDSQLTERVSAKVGPANAGIVVMPEKDFFAQQGKLQLDIIEPMKMSGTFEMHGAVNNTSLTGSFSFDVSEYFSN